MVISFIMGSISAVVVGVLALVGYKLHVRRRRPLVGSSGNVMYEEVMYEKVEAGREMQFNENVAFLNS